MLLNVKDLAQINEDFRQADVPEIKLHPQPLAMEKEAENDGSNAAKRLRLRLNYRNPGNPGFLL